MNVIKLSKNIATYFLVVLFYSTSVSAQSYPDFTEIVEQNMPAVVIAAKFQGACLDSMIYLKFFDERRDSLKLTQVLFY